MALLTIVNLTAEAILLQELYTTIGPGNTVTTTRYHDDLHSVPRIQALWEAGKISVTITQDTSENDFIIQKVLKHDGAGGFDANAIHTNIAAEISTIPSKVLPAAADLLVIEDSAAGNAKKRIQLDSILPGGPVDANAVTVKHVDIATATGLKQGQGATTPDIVYKGNLVYMEFNHTTDVAFYLWKVGRDFKDTPALHVHWTKSQDVNESGNTVRWRIDYTAYTSSVSTAGNAAVTGTFVDTGNLTYAGGDANTDRLVYRSPDMPIVVTAGQYVAVKISSPVPGGVSVTNPGLVSVDLTYNAYINKPT